MAFDEVDEMFKRLMLHPGMKGILVFNHHGICIKSNMDREKTRHVMGLISPFMDLVARVGESLLYEDSWETVRIRSFKQEIMIGPSKDFTLVCIQEPKIGCGIQGIEHPWVVKMRKQVEEKENFVGVVGQGDGED